MNELNVYVSPHGNAFMRDIASWIAEAGAETGRVAHLVDDGSPPTDGTANNLVVAPHEFYLLSGFDDATIHRAAQVSTPVCTEQPGTPWFEIGLITTRASQIAFDINLHGVAALQADGIDARHLRLGGVPSMCAPSAARDLELLFLGGQTPRRSERLAALAPLLWRHDVDLRLFSFTRPVQDGAAGLVFGRDKYELLARSEILLNLHRSERTPGYFEWARVVEAMANGCCVVSEPVDGHAPFVAGEHLIVTDDIDTTLAELLSDHAQRRSIGEAARTAVLDTYPLRDSLGPLLDELDARPTPDLARSARPPRYQRRMIVAQQHPLLPAFRPTSDLRERTYRALMAETRLQRKIERARSLVRHGVVDHIERTVSSAYESASPQVSIIVTLYNYVQVVLETLDSIAASHGIDFEIVIVDDHSTDDGRETVKRFIDDHEALPILLLGSDINRGLPAARNLGFANARADLVMVMDADNLIYPNALQRLAAALESDPDAAFAYSTLEEFGVSTGVRSAMAWDIDRLCDSNYIDAQAMIRLSAWERHGGYRTDDELIFGWEDWELWLRFANAGEHGVHLPQMLGRYRTQAQSMISTTNLVADHMYRHLQRLYPNLPWPEAEPA